MSATPPPTTGLRLRQYAQPLQRLDNAWDRITPACDFRTVATGAHTKKIHQRAQAGAHLRLAPPQVEMVHVAPEPATPDSEPIVAAFGNGFTGGAAHRSEEHTSELQSR